MNEGYVRSEVRNCIKTIEFFHPQSNSLPASLLAELAKEIHSAAADEDTKVIVLRSGGEKAFCAGASFEELASLQTEQEGIDFFSGFAHVINAMRKCPQFIIARIHGRCVGGGVGIAAAADYAIALEVADVRLSELSVGIGPFVIGPAVERKIGLAAFSHLSIDASMWRSADWAWSKGMYAELHSTIADLDESVGKLASSLVQSNPAAMAELKKTMWKGTENWDHLLVERAAISGRLALSDFTKKAIDKFQKARMQRGERPG